MMDLYTDCPDCDGKGYVFRPVYNDTPVQSKCQTCNAGRAHVRVKPLEWDGGRIAEWKALQYTIVLTVGPRYLAYHRGVPMNGFDTLEAAQAACQEHHERMVMSMLEVV